MRLEMLQRVLGNWAMWHRLEQHQQLQHPAFRNKASTVRPTLGVRLKIRMQWSAISVLVVVIGCAMGKVDLMILRHKQRRSGQMLRMNARFCQLLSSRKRLSMLELVWMSKTLLCSQISDPINYLKMIGLCRLLCPSPTSKCWMIAL